MENMINRRRYKRFLLSGIVTLKFSKKDEIQSIQTVIANISLGGIGVYSYKTVEVKTSVSINTNFISIDGNLKTDTIEGRVISNRKIGNTYFIGIQFNEEIDAKNQPSLFKYLKDILPKD